MLTETVSISPLLVFRLQSFFEVRMKPFFCCVALSLCCLTTGCGTAQDKTSEKLLKEFAEVRSELQSLKADVEKLKLALLKEMPSGKWRALLGNAEAMLLEEAATGNLYEYRPHNAWNNRLQLLPDQKKN